MGIVPLTLLALYFVMIDAQFLILDSEKNQEAVGSFLLAPKTHQLPLLTPCIWSSSQEAQGNQKIIFMSMSRAPK